MTKIWSSARADSATTSSVKLVRTVVFKAWAKKLTKLFTKVSLRMTFTMATVDTFTPTVITIWVIGSTASGPAGVN